MRKQALSSLPKTLRKKVHAVMGTQLLVESQVQVVRKYEEHGEVMQEVCQTPNMVCCGQWGRMMQKLPSETLRVFTPAGEGGSWG